MADLDKLVGVLVGLVVGRRVFDDTRPLWARLAYGAVSVDLIRMAMGESKRPALISGTQQSAIAARIEPTVPLKFEERQARNIDERVAYVHEQTLAGTRDPKVYALARSVLNRKCGGDWCVPERDSLGEIRALFGEVRSRVRYTLDPVDFDAFQTPNKTLELGAGDCDDATSLLGALCRSIGYPVKSRVVHLKGQPTWGHIYLVAKLPNGEWIPLDPTVKAPPGWEVPKELVLRLRDFEVTEVGAPHTLPK